MSDIGQKELKAIWKEFLANKGDSLIISLHCFKRFRERFPEQNQTEEDLLKLVKTARPLKIFRIGESDDGIQVKKQNIIFAICFSTGKVMSAYPPQKKIQPKGRLPKRKIPYQRALIRAETQKLISMAS